MQFQPSPLTPPSGEGDNHGFTCDQHDFITIASSFEGEFERSVNAEAALLTLMLIPLNYIKQWSG